MSKAITFERIFKRVSSEKIVKMIKNGLDIYREDDDYCTL